MAANPNSDSHSLLRSRFLGEKRLQRRLRLAGIRKFFPPYMKANLAKGIRIEVVAIFSQFLPKEGEGEGNQPVVLRSPARRVVCHLNCVGSAVADEFLLHSAEMQCYYLS